MEQEGVAAELQQGWYSVWAQPSAAQEPPGLKPAMLHLSTLFQGPSFDPHVTVLGDHKLSLQHATFSLRSACRALAPFTCRLTQPACGNTFYQCVYMLVDRSLEVMHAYKVVEGIFETSPRSNEEKTRYGVLSLRRLFHPLSPPPSLCLFLPGWLLIPAVMSKMYVNCGFQPSRSCWMSSQLHFRCLGDSSTGMVLPLFVWWFSILALDGCEGCKQIFYTPVFRFSAGASMFFCGTLEPCGYREGFSSAHGGLLLYHPFISCLNLCWKEFRKTFT